MKLSDMPPRRLALLRRLGTLPENAALTNVCVRAAEHLCRDGLADYSGDLKAGSAYHITHKGRKALESET